jgi:hypothetical protein
MKMSPFKAHRARRRAPLRAPPAVEALEARWVLSPLYNSPGSAALGLLRSDPPAGGAGHPGRPGPGGLQAIDQPDALYLASTTKLAITAPDGTYIRTLSDGTETANIGPQGGDARTVPNTWSSWSVPPDAESATPRLLDFFTDNTETIQLARPAVTFGFELEPAVGYTFPVTATFMDPGGGVIGVVARDVSGLGGARLFAGTVASGNPLISSVSIQIPHSADGYGLAQVRYSLTAFAPAGPWVVSSTPAGPVQGLDHATVTFNEPVDPGTFDPTQVSLTDPDGNPVRVTGIETQDDTTYTISFDPQNTLGQYSLVVGPNVADFSGNQMDQDFDGGVLGDADDAYATTLTVTNELVVNGGFETSGFAPWVLSGDSDYSGVIYVPRDGTYFVHGGSYAADLGATSLGSLGVSLTQTLATTPGTTYALDFWLSNPYGRTPSQWQVRVGGTVLQDVTDPPAFTYTEFTFTFTATSTATDLQFGSVYRTAHFFLDDVSVTPSGTPDAARGGQPHSAAAGAAPLLDGSGLARPAASPVTSPAPSLPPATPAAPPAAAAGPGTAGTDALFAAFGRGPSAMAPALAGAGDGPLAAGTLARAGSSSAGPVYRFSETWMFASGELAWSRDKEDHPVLL